MRVPGVRPRWFVPAVVAVSALQACSNGASVRTGERNAPDTTAFASSETLSPAEELAVLVKGDSDGEELRYWACERTAAAAAALTRYAVDAAGQDGESTRSDWEAVYLELSSAVVATGDDALQKGVEMAVPGPGRTATDSAFAGLDELAGRCEQLGNPIDVVLTGQIGVSRSCEVTGDVTAASIRRGIASGTVVGPFRSSTERTPADGTLEFVSSRLETEASDGIATWVLRPDGGGVFAVDWRAKRSTAFEASETARVFRAFDLSRACAADAGARSS